MKKEYTVEIFAVAACILLLLYMIFTWKVMTPDIEGASTEITSVEVSPKGVEQ